MRQTLTGRTVRLRKTSPDDVPFLVDVRNRSRYSFFDGRKVDVASTRRWLTRSRKAGQLNWIVEAGGIPVGTISALPQDGHGVEIGRMITHPDHRGKGYMKEALRLVTRFARRRFGRPVFLEVKPDNPKAILLYQRSGYKITRFRMEYSR